MNFLMFLLGIMGVVVCYMLWDSFFKLTKK